jgi:hypothetical protein
MTRAALLIGLVACTGANPRFCDAQHACDDPAYPYCDPVAEECQASPPDFSADAAVDLAGCATSAACDDATPICAAPICRACAGPADDLECAIHDPATPRCGSAGTCVACRDLSDCAAPTPICDKQTCRVCRAHVECPSGACQADGSCAPAVSVAYVNNSAAACSDTVHASTLAAPYCQVQAAAVTSGKPFVVVAGSPTAYAALSFTAALSVTIVGPGKTALPTALLSTATAAPAVSLAPLAGQTIAVTLDGLELTGSAGAVANRRDGLVCTATSGTATVVVRNSLIDGSGLSGVNALSCAITVDACTITGNSGGGVLLAGLSDYIVTNSFITANGSGAATNAGVVIANGATGVFVFNTVAKNAVAAGVGGIDCGSGAAKTISNTIAWSNTTSGGTQLGAQCALDEVVTAAGDDTRGTMNAAPPAFVSATDFHLDITAGLAANRACCIDKIAAPATPNADHDVDGVTRPRGAAWDVGAHEAM